MFQYLIFLAEVAQWQSNLKLPVRLAILAWSVANMCLLPYSTVGTECWVFCGPKLDRVAPSLFHTAQETYIEA